MSVRIVVLWRLRKLVEIDILFERPKRSPRPEVTAVIRTFEAKALGTPQKTFGVAGCVGWLGTLAVDITQYIAFDCGEY